jgi:alkanesulfonate monooxygenase SsuD/methylene tetrahydromethanopterin reductase-like flavin-dependent oxidoreductase (luciferase family)
VGPTGDREDGAVPTGDREADPVRVRRARWVRAAKAVQRLGYAGYLVATVAFFVGLARGFGAGLVRVIEVGLIGGSILLAPAILVVYMAKAAERDDLEHGR